MRVECCKWHFYGRKNSLEHSHMAWKMRPFPSKISFYLRCLLEPVSVSRRSAWKSPLSRGKLVSWKPLRRQIRYHGLVPLEFSVRFNFLSRFRVLECFSTSRRPRQPPIIDSFPFSFRVPTRVYSNLTN